MAGTPEQHIYMLRNKLQDANKAAEDEMRQKTEFKNTNDQLMKLLRTQKDAITKLERHAKNCEKATNKAQKEAKNAKGHADHLVGSQKGQLKNAERRYETAARDLQAWRDKYGLSVEKPAEEKDALQATISEWQSKAQKAQNQIASLEELVQGTPEQIGLHQALEQWEEHQGCSEEFADLQDKVHDGKLLKEKLESDLNTSRERHQKAKSDIKALQVKAHQLEQANQALKDQDGTQDYILHIQNLESDLKASTELHQITEGNMKALQEQLVQLEQANQALKDQDETQDYILHIQNLESDFRASAELHQITEGDMKALQEQVIQLEQANQTFRDREKTDVDMLDDDVLDREKLVSDLKASQEQHQEAESEMKALQEKAERLEQANKAFKDQEKSHNDMLQKLESDQKASKEQLQETGSNMKAVQGLAEQLDSELKTAKEQHQSTKSDMEALQGLADQLGSELKTAKEQHQSTKSDMEALQGLADQLQSELKTAKEQNQATKSDKEALQGLSDQLESELELANEQVQALISDMEGLQGLSDLLESELKTAKEEHQTTKSDMEALQGKADQLEQANQEFQEKENKTFQTKISEEKVQGWKRNSDLSDAVQRDIEERTRLLQSQIGTPMEAERSQVTPPASPTYTTDEGSLDLEKTPRAKKSLRQDLGYSSRDQSDEYQSDVSMPQQQGVMMSKQAETSEEKKAAGAANWETDGSEDVGEHARGSMRRKMKKLLSLERQAKNLETLEMRGKGRAKEQSEALESLFECTPAKADAIDRRLKALGPGCRLHEAPALVAFELSGIPEDTYKGLASGQLIATMPLNEVKDVGTNPDVFADDRATDTTDLPAEEVAVPLRSAKDMATDTTDLPVKEVADPLRSTKDMATDTTDLPVKEVADPLRSTKDMATDTTDLPVKEVADPLRSAKDMATDTTDLPVKEVADPLRSAKDMATDTTDLPVKKVADSLRSAKDMATDTTDLPVKKFTVTPTRFSSWALFIYALMSLMILFSLFSLYSGLKSDPHSKIQHGIVYKNVYSHRYTPLPAPSRHASTPITFVYPPMPAPQLGLAMMMKGGSLGGGVRGW